MRAALQKGNALSDEERQSIAQQMSQLTGLSPDYILRSNLRVEPEPLPARAASRPAPDHRPNRFALSSAPSPTPSGEAPSYDPQAQRDHRRLRRRDQRLSVPRPRLQDAADLPAEQLRAASAATGTSSTRRRTASSSLADTSADLADGDARRTRGMKILSVNGLYDLATPFFGAEYDLGHMALEPQLAANIRYTYYPAGHMMYIDPPSARQLKADLAASTRARM